MFKTLLTASPLSLRLLLSGLAALLLCGASPAPAVVATIPTYSYKVVRSYPHDPDAFTQGLFFLNGFLYESTGLEGRSSVRKVRLETGEVLQKTNLPPELFGEGITFWENRLIGVTWTTQLGFELNLQSFAFEKRFSYTGEGWGLARSERELIMSDGTPELRFLNPLTLKETRRIRVTAAGKPVPQLNELEWVKGEIYANVWQTDLIARIDPKNGQVVGWIKLDGLLPAAERAAGHADVLNGIAYDAAGDRLFVTGKLWPRLYEIKLVRQLGQ